MQPLDRIREKLSAHPELPVRDEGSSLTVTASEPQGFDVSFAQDDEGFVVSFGPCHEHFSLPDADSALECFSSGLSESSRLRVHSRGGVDYRWTLEALEDGTWHTRSTTYLLLFPYWRRRSVRHLQNPGLRHEA
jgi:hypothetical protein